MDFEIEFHEDRRSQMQFGNEDNEEITRRNAIWERGEQGEIRRTRDIWE